MGFSTKIALNALVMFCVEKDKFGLLVEILKSLFINYLTDLVSSKLFISRTNPEVRDLL